MFRLSTAFILFCKVYSFIYLCLQTLEAFYFALDAVNSNDTLLPGIRLGGLTIDSCDNEQYALEQTMELVQVSIVHNIFSSCLKLYF